MSKASDQFEQNLVQMINKYKGYTLPSLPDWMLHEGIVPNSKIISAEGIGSISKDNKTDVIIHLENSAPIKISAKLSNAHFFGNWYGHKRFIAELGNDAFIRMTKETTLWANNWMKTAKAPFVGVSLCFGKRSGRTAQNFTDIFKHEDILTVVRGFGCGDSVANCMFVANSVKQDLDHFIKTLQPIKNETIHAATNSFKIAYRPINPLTECSNRGKNVYTRFVPFKKCHQKMTITSASELFKIGNFQTVEPNLLTHNNILNNLEAEYNIVIPRKPKH